jgi:hypothetical protein
MRDGSAFHVIFYFDLLLVMANICGRNYRTQVSFLCWGLFLLRAEFMNPKSQFSKLFRLILAISSIQISLNIIDWEALRVEAYDPFDPPF